MTLTLKKEPHIRNNTKIKKREKSREIFVQGVSCPALAPAATPRDPMERDKAVSDDDMTKSHEISWIVVVGRQ